MGHIYSTKAIILKGAHLRTSCNFHHKLPWIVPSRVVLPGRIYLFRYMNINVQIQIFIPATKLFLLIQVNLYSQGPCILTYHCTALGQNWNSQDTIQDSLLCFFSLERADCLSAGCLTRCTGGWWPAAASGRSPSAACTSCPASAGERASQSRYEQSVPWFCNISSNILDANNVVTWVKDVVN